MTDPLNYRPSDSTVHYKPPLPFDGMRLGVSVVISAVSIIIGSIVYAILEPKLDNITLRVCGCICAGIVLGVLTLVPIRIGQVRIPMLASIVGSLLGILSIYTIWIVWLFNILRIYALPISFIKLITHPVMDIRLIRAVNAVGTWSIHGDVQKGIPLLIFWLGESAIILGCGVAFPILGLYSGDPACIECGARCKRASNLPRFAADRQKDLVATIENREFGSLVAYPAAEHGDQPEISLRLMSCPSCGKLNVLTVNRIAWTRNSQGRRVVKFTPLLDQILITRDEADRLKEICGQINALREFTENSSSPASQSDSPAK